MLVTGYWRLVTEHSLLATMIDLSGRVAIVTGASRGIGRAIAQQLARQGRIVVAAARGENARPVADEITAAGGRAEAVALDVTEAGAAERVVATTLERHRADRYPGEQRRHHARPVDAADEARGLGRGDRDEPDGGVRAARRRC